MAVSDAVVGNITTVYLAIIGAMKAYGLITGHTYTGAFVLAASTAVVALLLVAALTWDVSRKGASAVPSSAAPHGGEMCRGGICWHGVAVKSPASQVWFRLPQHHHFAPPPM
ncbi:hypothetical protein RND81_02G067300 [Saponaria officinalis]|uniref:Uncharacterized protein n=1 Tax=Saponaria officinalis TaxID=3572 RepID=A0AAW1MRN8_SAPOF